MSKSHGDRGDNADKVRSLKKRVESLKKENDRLHKELNKALDFVAQAKNVLLEKEVEYVETPRNKKKKGDGDTCPECGKGHLTNPLEVTLPTGKKIYLTCDTCGYRAVRVIKDDK